MKYQNLITSLVIVIAIVAVIVTAFGIFSDQGDGSYQYRSIRGENITIYGKGLYRHMSADVAIQGIAQDYVTLVIGIPLLLTALYFARQGSLRGRLVLSGVLGYFWLTYLFYTAMAMYSIMFLPYVFLLSASFFTLILTLSSYTISIINTLFRSVNLLRLIGLFLVINATMVTFLWLSTVIPPLLDGSIYPKALQHYTTLIVQGFDLGLFLPMAYISGILAMRKSSWGYLFVTIYVIFLSLLMTALTAKIIFMAKSGANVFPVVIIMPTIGMISIIFSLLLLKSVRARK